MLGDVLSLLGGRPATALGQGRRLAALGPLHAARYRLGRSAGSGFASQDDVYAEIWGGAAAEVGAEMARYANGFLELRAGGAAARVRHNWTPLDDVVARAASLDKPFVHQRLAAAGVPVPPYLEFTLADIERAQSFLRDTSGAPIIVKPASGTGGGQGVTGGIRRPRDLVWAALNAARFDRRLLVERQGPGSMYRILLLDGDLIDVIVRHPPQLTGDGRTSIAGLVIAENRRRIAARGRAGLMLLALNLDCELALRDVSCTPRSVLPEGKTVSVKTISSDAGAKDNETIREPIADDLLADARRAAAEIGARVAGVDVITPDLSSGLSAAGGYAIEVNCPPGLQHHYQVREPGAATPVAVPILRRLLEEATQEGERG